MLKKYLKRNSKHAAADPVLSTQLNHSTVTTHSAFPHYQDKKMQQLLEFSQKPHLKTKT